MLALRHLKVGDKFLYRPSMPYGSFTETWIVKDNTDTWIRAFCPRIEAVEFLNPNLVVELARE